MADIRKEGASAEIISLDRHPLLVQWYALMVEVDKLPAHIEQTALIIALGEWGNKLKAHLATHKLLLPPASRGELPWACSCGYPNVTCPRTQTDCVIRA